MEIKSIGILSAGKIMGATYALLGLIAGAFVSLIALAGAGAMQNGGMEGIMFGAGAVIMLPIFYGILGFFGGIITAAIYNLVAAMIGGLELTVDLGEPDRQY